MANIGSAIMHEDQEDQSSKLRKELKEWERAFSAAHEGRKAGREDIKQHPDIGLRSQYWQLLIKAKLRSSKQIQVLRQITNFSSATSSR